MPDSVGRSACIALLRLSVWVVASFAPGTIVGCRVSAMRTAPRRVGAVLFRLFLEVHNLCRILGRGIYASVYFGLPKFEASPRPSESIVVRLGICSKRFFWVRFVCEPAAHFFDSVLPF